MDGSKAKLVGRLKCLVSLSAAVLASRSEDFGVVEVIASLCGWRRMGSGTSSAGNV
jgi:hypothetical protein